MHNSSRCNLSFNWFIFKSVTHTITRRLALPSELAGYDIRFQNFRVFLTEPVDLNHVLFEPPINTSSVAIARLPRNDGFMAFICLCDYVTT